jgi:hypothetical protein
MRFNNLGLVRKLMLLSSIVMLGIALWPPSRDVQSSALGLNDERNFVGLLSMQFREFDFKAPLNFSSAASITAIPMLQSPVREAKEFEGRWITIGGLYVPAGSPRLKLESGGYRVELSRKSGSWMARFTDEKGENKGEMAADVKPAPSSPVPSASVEHSVCYRFDKTIVCI